VILEHEMRSHRSYLISRRIRSTPKHEVDVPSDQNHQEKFEDNIGNQISITQIHDIPYSYYLSSMSVKSEGVKEGKSMYQYPQWRAFQISQTIQMSNQSSLRDSTTESETSIKIRRPFESFSGLRRGWIIQRVGSTIWVTQSPRSAGNRIRALYAAYSQAPSLEKISWQQQWTCLSEHLVTPRDGSAIHEWPRLLNETTSYSLMGIN
jgi:hypothetical protein